MEFDQHVLKRPRAHCRNALRSTEQLQTILGQLNKVRTARKKEVKIKASDSKALIRV